MSDFPFKPDQPTVSVPAIDPGTVVESDWPDEYRKGYHHGVARVERDYKLGFEDAIKLASEKVGRLAKLAEAIGDEHLSETLGSIARGLSIMEPKDA